MYIHVSWSQYNTVQLLFAHRFSRQVANREQIDLVVTWVTQYLTSASTVVELLPRSSDNDFNSDSTHYGPQTSMEKQNINICMQYV